MERYHIFKLGLAILFYAAYCIRPMMVHGLNVDNSGNNRNIPGDDYFVYYQGVQGKPGVDFPVFSHIPRTIFSCKGIESGYYADLETDCQVFHICEDGKKISFLCPNGTIFDQTELICEWWFKVNCTTSPDFYEESAEQLRKENARRKAQQKQHTKQNNHGAVMRTEEQKTISAVKNGKNYQINSHYIQRDNKQNENTPKPFNLANDINVNYKPQAIKAPQTLVEVFNDTDQGQTFQQYNNQEHKQSNKQQYSNNNYEKQTSTTKAVNQESFTSRPSQSRGQVKYSGFNSNKLDNSKSDKPQNIVLKVSANLGGQSKPYTSTTKRPSQDRILVSIRTDQPAATITRTLSKEVISQPQENQNNFVNIRTNQHTTSTKKINLENSGKDSQQPKQQSTAPLNKVDITNRRLEPSDSEESQITQETASFYKNNFNSINQNYKPSQNSHPNHRETYSDLREPNYYSNKILSTLSSVTPHYLTTQPINSGRPFIGSQVGTSFKSTTKSHTNSFNNVEGNDKYAKTTTISPTTYAFNTESTAATSTSSFNTETISTTPKLFVSTVKPFTNNEKKPQLFSITPSQSSLKPNPYLPSPTSSGIPNQSPTANSIFESSSKTPIRDSKVYKINILPPPPPPPNSFNLGEVEKGRSIDFSTPIDDFTVGPLITTTIRPIPSPGSLNVGVVTTSRPTSTTSKIVDHAVVYGKYKSTPSPVQNNGTVYGRYVKSTTPVSPTPSLSPSSNGFFVTKSTLIDVYDRSKFKDEIQKPRPFQLSISSTEAPRQPKKLPDPHPFYKISTASPFVPYSTTLEPTQPTYAQNSPIKNVDNMINALAEMAKRSEEEDYSGEGPRPGLVIPPSAGPQTLHTLAQYFANALDDIVAGTDETEEPVQVDTNVEKEKLTALLTKMTMDRYSELTQEQEKQQSETTTEFSTTSHENSDNDLEGQHSKNPAQTPRVRQLARVFTQALSSYLDDPETFKRVLEEVRPTEPPPLKENQTKNEEDTEDELLNFSDADTKSNYPPIYSTTPSVQPTWGYILAINESQPSPNLDIRNSLNQEENLQLADSQSFVSQYNNLRNDEKPTTTTKPPDNLPDNHWTASPQATKLWASTLALNPASINQDFGIVSTTEHIGSQEEATSSEDEDVTPVPELKPHHEINYEIRSLPNLKLNSTQVHGILIDYMNTTKTDKSNRLQRILRRLNTTEEEFLTKMKEIENNPLTRRLILLLISECGDNATKAEAVPLRSLITRESKEILEASSSSTNPNSTSSEKSSNHFKKLVDPSIDEESQDGRALQLLNSLYTIASRFGKK